MVNIATGSPAGDLAIDHLIIACPSLEAGIDWFAAITGVTASPGGSHPGRGTRNALAGAGPGVYLELLAPDPGQALAGTFGAGLAPLAGPTLFGLMLRTSSIATVAEAFAREGLAAERIAATRTLPDGRTLAWELLIPAASEWGLVLPNFIDWRGSPHPADSAPAGCRLERLRAEHPRAAALAAIWNALGIPILLEEGPAPRLVATLATPLGEHTLG